MKKQDTCNSGTTPRKGKKTIGRRKTKNKKGETKNAGNKKRGKRRTRGHKRDPTLPNMTIINNGKQMDIKPTRTATVLGVKWDKTGSTQTAYGHRKKLSLIHI